MLSPAIKEEYFWEELKILYLMVISKALRISY